MIRNMMCLRLQKEVFKVLRSFRTQRLCEIGNVCLKQIDRVVAYRFKYPEIVPKKFHESKKE